MSLEWQDVALEVVRRFPWLRESTLEKSLQGEGLSQYLEGIGEGRNTVFLMKNGVEPIFNFVFQYRVAPPGQERTRIYPWFYLGPLVPYTSTYFDLGLEILKTASDVGPKPPPARVFPGMRIPLVVAASYPRISDMLQSNQLLQEYAYWDRLSSQNPRRLGPLLMSRESSIELCIQADPRRQASEYADMFARLFSMADSFEVANDVEPASKVPIPYGMLTIPGQSSLVPLYPCPQCGRWATTTGVTRGSVFSRRAVNAQTTCCRQLLFRTK